MVKIHGRSKSIRDILAHAVMFTYFHELDQ